MAGDDVSTLYAPTCNLLVRREAYLGVGGINEDLRVGEDVDLCWRLRKTGSYLVYAPAGRVQHRHRSGLWATLKRRADYGTSEALLHDLHRDKRKRFVLPVAGVLGFAALVAGLLVNPWFLALAPVPALFEGARKVVRLRAERAGVRAPRVWFAVLRGHLSFLYFMLFHLVRYYLLVLLVAGVFAHRLWWLAAVALIYTALVDFWVKRPRLNAITFLFYYAAEHAAYQAGVVAGCLRRHSFRSYLLSFRRGAGWAGGAGTSALGR